MVDHPNVAAAKRFALSNGLDLMRRGEASGPKFTMLKTLASRKQKPIATVDVETVQIESHSEPRWAPDLGSLVDLIGRAALVTGSTKG